MQIPTQTVKIHLKIIYTNLMDECVYMPGRKGIFLFVLCISRLNECVRVGFVLNFSFEKNIEIVQRVLSHHFF